jgi:hypothetical protein
MDTRVHWVDRPLWLRLVLLGVPSPRAALLWMRGALAFTVLFLIAIFAVPITASNGATVGLSDRILCAAPFALILLLVPLWYWAALRWADADDGRALWTWRS